MRVVVRAPLRPTEDEARVRDAAMRFLPDGEAGVDGDTVVVHGTDLRPLRARIWELRIIDTARARLLAGAVGGRMQFGISKQAAFAGKVSFPPAPHVLGDLRWDVEVEHGDPWKDAEALAWWMCPETRDGEIVGPKAP